MLLLRPDLRSRVSSFMCTQTPVRGEVLGANPTGVGLLPGMYSTNKNLSLILTIILHYL